MLGAAMPRQQKKRRAFPPQRVQLSDRDRFVDFTRRVNNKSFGKRETPPPPARIDGKSAG
jgi:hypothetical protein